MTEVTKVKKNYFALVTNLNELKYQEENRLSIQFQ